MRYDNIGNSCQKIDLCPSVLRCFMALQIIEKFKERDNDTLLNY